MTIAAAVNITQLSESQFALIRVNLLIERLVVRRERARRCPLPAG